MNGSITKLEKKRKDRCRHWRLRVSTKNEHGKFVQRSRNFWGTWSEAVNALDDFFHEVKHAPMISSATCGEWFERWLKTSKSQLSTGTIEKRKYLIACANEFLRDVKLRDVRPSMLEEVYEKLMQGKRESGKAVSGTYVAMIHTCLFSCFKAAQKDGLIAQNPCELAKRPKLTTAEKKAIPVERLLALEAELNAESASEFGVLMLCKTGLRRGEVAALAVGDWDRQNHTIKVNHSFTETGELKDPKTKKSKRELPLTPQAESVLETRLRAIESDFKRVRDETGNKLPIVDENTPFVCNEFGQRQNPQNLSLWWRRNRGRFGLDEITLHGLRHSYISAMVNRGADLKTVSELAGHASIRVTADIYTHSEFEHKREQVEKYGF